MAQFMTSMSDLMGRSYPFMQQLPGLVGKGVGELFEDLLSVKRDSRV